MESGIIIIWHVAEGDEFAEGEPLYEVETDKMTSEVEAKQAGRLLRIAARAGTEIPVGTVLAVAAEPGEVNADEEITAFLADTGVLIPAAGADDSQAAAPATAVAQPVDPAGAAPSGRPKAVPKARAQAKALGIDLAAVRGSGPNGVIRVADVAALSSAQTDGPNPRVAERIPLQGVRKAMAEAVTRSWKEIPQFVQQVSLDAMALQARLNRLRYEGLAVTYTDLLISAVAKTAADCPDVNARYTADGIIRFADVNVSFAVASDRGLLVPTIQRADHLSIHDLAEHTKSLAAKAKDRKLSADDVRGGTITVSNLGAFGIDTGTPLVNAPHCATVFVGSLRDEAVVLNGQIVIQPRLHIAIAYDHRVVDGMTAAGFTTGLKERLEAGG